MSGIRRDGTFDRNGLCTGRSAEAGKDGGGGFVSAGIENGIGNSPAAMKIGLDRYKILLIKWARTEKAMKRTVSCGVHAQRGIPFGCEDSHAAQTKTTSERPQYGPVIPLSSEIERFS